MKQNQNTLTTSGRGGIFSNSFMGKNTFFAIIIGLSIFLSAGCKKGKVDDVSYYGYGKLTVDCEKKCHVTFGSGDKLTDFDVDATIATYTFRYQSKYQLDIKITPLEQQNITLNVYSREQRQIFHNTAKRPGAEVWQSLILVP